MHSFLNSVRFILLLSCVIAVVTADGNNTAPVSIPAPSKKSEKAIIVNANGNSGHIEIANTKDSHNAEKAIKSLEATLEKNFQKLIYVVNATSRGNPNVRLSRRVKTFTRTIRTLSRYNMSQGNRAYLLKINAAKVPVFCHMTIHGLGACGGGGWTLVMKIDGAKATFRYDSQLWSNKIDFNLPGGKTGFDHPEAKLPTYWNTPFSKICLGMKIGHQINFVAIDKQANSLYSLIADGKYRPTSLGRNTWKTLIGSQVHSATVTWKDSMQWFILAILKQESVSLATTKMSATAVIPESGLVQEGTLMVPIRVGTRPPTVLIMGTKASKSWDTSWSSDIGT
ncbi:hypothetical protein ACROYT_G041223 [Oculina patagonica]